MNTPRHSFPPEVTNSGPDPAFVPAASSRDASRPCGLQSGVKELDWAAWSKLRAVERLARSGGQTFIADLIQECIEAFVGGSPVPSEMPE